ncbi:unnamed protein product, partial [Allacma fusca]
MQYYTGRVKNSNTFIIAWSSYSTTDASLKLRAGRSDLYKSCTRVCHG